MTKKSKGPSLAQIAHIEAISVLVEAFFFGATVFSNLLVHVADIEDTRGILGYFHLLHYCVVGSCSGSLFTLSHQPRCRRSPSRARHAMLALSVVMYAASAAHLALFISRIEVFLADPSARVDVKDWAVVYLPSINVCQVLLAKISANWGEVHPK